FQPHKPEPRSPLAGISIAGVPDRPNWPGSAGHGAGAPIGGQSGRSLYSHSFLGLCAGFWSSQKFRYVTSPCGITRMPLPGVPEIDVPIVNGGMESTRRALN